MKYSVSNFLSKKNNTISLFFKKAKYFTNKTYKFLQKNILELNLTIQYFICKIKNETKNKKTIKTIKTIN